MPSKSSRRKRARNQAPRKRTASTAPQNQTPEVAEAPAVAETRTAAPEQPVARPATRRATTTVRSRVQEVVDPAIVYAHVKPELMRIGILAVIMLVILGILGAVL